MKNKFISSFKDVVVFAFCFVLLGSLVLSLSLPKKTSAGDVAEPVGGWPEEDTPIEAEDISNVKPGDQGSEPDPDDTVVGDTFTGPTGTTYELQEENISDQEKEDLANLGYVGSGVWVEVEEDGGNGNGGNDKGYSCSGAPNYTCSQKSNGTYSSLAACQSNCKKPSTIIPTVEPSQARYRCRQCRGTSCSVRYSDTPCSDTCRTPENCVGISTHHPPSTSPHHPTATTSPPSHHVSPTSPPPATEPCMISYFELPARAWVGYSITGRWAASAWCDDCDVTCTPYPECVWKQDNIGIGNIGANEYKFKFEQSGTYNYTLTCHGETSEDQDEETTTVQVLNLPWWREIIPVLPGFLGGIWR